MSKMASTATNRSTGWLPTNPAPPVTKNRFKSDVIKLLLAEKSRFEKAIFLPARAISDPRHHNPGADSSITFLELFPQRIRSEWQTGRTLKNIPANRKQPVQSH
jgi:hypothetical protein